LFVLLEDTGVDARSIEVTSATGAVLRKIDLPIATRVTSGLSAEPLPRFVPLIAWTRDEQIVVVDLDQGVVASRTDAVKDIDMIAGTADHWYLTIGRRLVSLDAVTGQVSGAVGWPEGDELAAGGGRVWAYNPHDLDVPLDHPGILMLDAATLAPLVPGGLALTDEIVQVRALLHP
jgi:hypothetical protein